MTLMFRKMLLGSVLVFSLVVIQGICCGAQPKSESEQVTQFLEEAQTNFENQDFSASFELYQRVLVLAPDNQTAREKIFELALMYKQLEDIARRDGELEKADILQRQQKDMTRYLLKIFTLQLETSIKNYHTQKAAEKGGEKVKERIVPVLETIIGSLDDLKNLYEKVTEDEERTQQMVERIRKTMTQYEQELTYYHELD